MKISKPKVVIAGAGGGKTHQMIKEIIKIIPELKKHPERFCAVVTYTNSATEEIRYRISKIIGIPNNLHISTTHSFFTRFIIDPYAHLVDLLPIDKFYIEKYVLTGKQLEWYKTKINQKSRKFVIGAQVYKEITKLSQEKGIVVYDKILEVSEEIINIDLFCNKISNRLKYIFVDEYQDMRILQHNIFQKIIEKGKTNFYCIGDPLQSIFHFSYTESHLGKKEKPQKTFDKSPILQFNNSDNFDKEKIIINNRSSKNVINLINNYTQIIDYKQELPIGKKCNQIPIFLVTGGNKSEIIEKYEQVIFNNNIKKEIDKMFSLLIAENWDAFDEINDLNTIKNEKNSTKTIFNECSRIVLAVLGINRATCLDFIPIKDKKEKYIHYRKFCFSILKDIRNQTVNVNCDYILNKFTETFNVRISENTRINIDITKALENIKTVIKTSDNGRFCSSIHTSKGLEATCVLVIAKTNNQLLKWLDFKNVNHDKDDDFRLGYVAFSRARELLCISILEKPNDKLLAEISKLNIKIL